MNVTRIGLVGLAEAGNFGDDLILLATAQAAAAAIGDVEVEYIGLGRPLDWEGLSNQINLPPAVRHRATGRDLPGSRSRRSLLSGCDAIVFGGGGLLQTTHHPERPYHWIRYLPSTGPLVPVLAVGLGLGPLSDVWVKRLRNMGSPFDACYLRDDDSLRLANQLLRWTAHRCRDFVDAEFLAQFHDPDQGIPNDHGSRLLGVALRDWEGLNVHDVAQHLATVAASHHVDQIRFYVLEANRDGPDIAFSQAVMDALPQFSSSIRCYEGRELIGFIRDLMSCEVAVSMKLHSSAVWAASGTDIYPISYAPKTSAFFGLPYTGLEIIDRIAQPLAEDPGVPRSHDVVKEWLREQRRQGFAPSARGPLSRRERFSGQSRAFFHNVANRLRR